MTLGPGHGRDAEALHQRRMGTVGRRGHEDAAAAVQPQAADHGAGGPSGAQHQHRGGRVEAAFQQGMHEAGHVGVLAAEPVVPPVQGVGGAHELHALAAVIQQGQDLHLVRQGDGAAADAQKAHAVHESRQFFRGQLPEHVGRGDAQGLEGGVVQQRAQALGQGPADDAIEGRGDESGHKAVSMKDRARPGRAGRYSSGSPAARQERKPSARCSTSSRPHCRSRRMACPERLPERQ